MVARFVGARVTLAGLALLGLALGACSSPEPGPGRSSSAPATPGASTVATPGASTGSEPEDGPDPVPAPSPATPPPAAATTPVPAPTPGDIRSTLRSQKVQRKRPVGLDASASPASGVSVKLTEVKAVQAEARGPGEVSGPGLQVGVEVVNRSDGPLDLGSSVVTLVGTRGVPGASMTGPPTNPLAGELAAGARTSGVYVFAVPVRARATVTIDVSVEGSLPTVVFKGKP